MGRNSPENFTMFLSSQNSSSTNILNIWNVCAAARLMLATSKLTREAGLACIYHSYEPWHNDGHPVRIVNVKPHANDKRQDPLPAL